MPPSTRASEPRLPGAKPSSRTSATGTQEHSPTCYTASLLHPLRSLSLLHPGEPILLARAASKFWQIRKGRGIDIIAYQVPCAGYETPARSMGASKRGSHGSWLPSWSGACSGSIPEGSMLSTKPIEAAANTIQDTSKGAGY